MSDKKIKISHNAMHLNRITFKVIKVLCPYHQHHKTVVILANRSVYIVIYSR